MGAFCSCPDCLKGAPPPRRLDREPFSTHRLWDPLTFEAYAAQPTRNGYHFRLDESCNAAEKQAWRSWCKAYPDHWPGHVKSYIERVNPQRAATKAARKMP